MKQTVRVAILVAAFLSVFLSRAAIAQRDDQTQPDPVAKRADIYCTGFIAELPPRTGLQVVGGDKENQQNSFAQGDIVFLNKGRESGVQSGAVYYIIRPLGEVKHPFTKKKIGHLVRELGLLRVIEVQNETAVAEITVSCDTVELGDLLKPYEAYTGPAPREARPLPRYGEGSGGVKGRIIMAPHFREYISANQVVYIDLGNRQGVRAGDYFTIYRKINKREGVANQPDGNIVDKRSSGYGSERYRGGDFSMSSTRVGRDKVMRTRPDVPRKVLGEMIVLKVENNAAVALITRTNAEVNIGDFIERAN